MNPDSDHYISAHSAASALVRRRVEQGLMTRENAIAFTDWIYNMVHTGQLPDDPNMLCLIERDWKVYSSGKSTTTTISDLTAS